MRYATLLIVISLCFVGCNNEAKSNAEIQRLQRDFDILSKKANVLSASSNELARAAWRNGYMYGASALDDFEKTHPKLPHFELRVIFKQPLFTQDSLRFEETLNK